VVGPGEQADTSQTAAFAADTVPSTPVDDAEEPGGSAAEPPARAGWRNRPPGLVLPVVVFAALLAAGAVIGLYVIPGGGPDPRPENVTEPTSPATVGGGASTPTPSLPALPTPPARPADALAPWAQQIGQILAVPEAALQAYGYAQLELSRTDPSCHLAWTTLAGIAEVESRHGQAGGAVLEPGGRSSPAIVGPLLDGKKNRPLVLDTDAGAFDGDATYDRAMGPFRLMPSLWRAHAIDADGDGILDPYDIDDATLALGRLLCSGGEDLNQLAGWTAALGRYRPGNPYARSVFQVADDYGRRTRSIG